MSDIQQCKAIRLKTVYHETDGVLNIGEQLKEIPFEIRRIYTITRLERPEAVRGRHAHRKLQQVIFCLRGSSDILLDDGTTQKTVTLDCPHEGLYLAPGIWHEVANFQKEPILLVLASEPYDERDYIRNYDEFIRLFHADPHPI